MKNRGIWRGLNIFFSVIGVAVTAAIIFLMITNAAGLGTLLSVIGLVKSQSLFDITLQEMIQGASAGIVDSLDDPYSKLLDKQTWEDLQVRLKAEFGGIGVYILQDEAGRLKIVNPIKGTPAYREGLQNGDIIMRINGESALNMSQDDAVHLMRGEPGTQLVLTIYRESDGQEHEFVIIREIINVPSVEDRMLDDKPAIGYIKLNQFHAKSAQEMADALNRLLKDHRMEGLVLDLRGNGGGDFEASIAIASLFLDGQVVVKEADAQNNETVHQASGEGLDIPLVVLVNGDSASASEILAGALQDNQRALLVGEKTYGKGLVQTIYPLRDGSALKLTTRKYYTPKGTDINDIGIVPDYVVEQEPDAQTDLQLEKAVELLKKEIL
ncbi:MAG TPA: S41 family peptidase [Syntrophomonadaceae bacterium]|nr:S41 family peptidase [Syntrophomonadaceae bacterium]HQE23839.1 S41 family peptidase [Syntrophomonadaceae bacterium]